MPLILRTIKIFEHILHNYVFDITSIVKISILEMGTWANQVPAIHV